MTNTCPLLLLLNLTQVQPLWSGVVEYELIISETQLSPAGKKRKALTINGGIPGPTLRFREGDVARITVRNALRKEETSIHWHGLLVPNLEDGVPYLTTPPIKPGKSRVFEYPLTHSGTYWYHSHTGLQEQRGVYGSIVITPKGGEQVKADHDFVAVLSDWTNESPKEVMRTLMRGSEYYAIRKGNAQSIYGAFKANALKDYFDREKSRMAPMDLSDIYYDAFLLNGQRVSDFAAKPGETVRLRLINAAASTYFYAHFAGGPLTVVAADGPEVEPVEVKRLLMGMAETYDVLLKIPEAGSWEFRVTAQDNTGHASLFLGSGNKHEASRLPSPNLYRMDYMLDAAMSSMGEQDQMEHPDRPAPPYQLLRAKRQTNPPKSAPVREIEMRLTGDMARYIWSFDNKTLAEDSTVPVNRGEVLRIRLINDTMMHHPIHLHGHFFRVLNGQGDRAPLKHTVDIPPMGRHTIEFLANEEGDWLFHCHMLYHMDAGMARVMSYAKARNPDHKPALDPKLINPPFLMLEGTMTHSMTMGNLTLMKGRENFGGTWDYGFHNHDEYEADFFGSHYFNSNLTTSLGYRITNEHNAENRGFAQVNYRMPYMVGTFLSVDTKGGARVGLGKDIPLTSRLSIFGDGEYDTNTEWECFAGATFLTCKQSSLIVGYHSEHGLSAGLTFRF